MEIEMLKKVCQSFLNDHFGDKAAGINVESDDENVYCTLHKWNLDDDQIGEISFWCNNGWITEDESIKEDDLVFWLCLERYSSVKKGDMGDYLNKEYKPFYDKKFDEEYGKLIKERNLFIQTYFTRGRANNTIFISYCFKKNKLNYEEELSDFFQQIINEKLISEKETNELKACILGKYINLNLKETTESTNIKRRFWIAGTSFGGGNQIETLVENHYWEGGECDTLNNIRNVGIGDILIANTSSTKGPGHKTPFIKVFAVGVVKSDMINTKERPDWYRCDVDWVRISPEVDFDGKEYGSYRKTMQECNDKLLELKNFALEKLNMDLIAVKQEQSEYAKLLIANHNIILHGAPGTGKTHLAKQIAKEIEAEYEMVQFHQSYDYTDFVEGLRPLKKDNSSDVYFEKVDGVFKSFCEKALKNLRNANEDNASKNKTLQTLLDDFLMLKEDSEDEFTLKKGDHFKISHSDNRYIYIDNGEKKQDVKIAKKDMARLLELDNIENVVEIKKIFNRTHRQKDSYMFSLYSEIKKLTDKHGKLSNLSIEKTSGDKEPLKKYVFIIDEINRGEISKIFGELFYAIDPGYRISWDDIVAMQKNESSKTFIRTQYANMDNDPNEWDDVLRITEENDYGHFFVPKNVYIIGTMNDIDRSVESMDFAMRRRFAFEEITAEQSMSMFDYPESWKGENDEVISIPNKVLTRLGNRMRNLNTAILNPKLNLGQAYQIGGAYFLKFAKYFKGGEEKAFADLWKYHLKGLLTEYLRGMPKLTDSLNKLEEAYKDIVDHRSDVPQGQPS